MQHTTSKPDVPALYLIRTHKWGDYIQHRFDMLCSALGPGNVMVLYDDTRSTEDMKARAPQPATRASHTSAETLLPYARTMFVSDVECIAKNSMHDKGDYAIEKVSWQYWHAEAPVVMAFDWAVAAGRMFEYIWVVEYDVVVSGDISRLFRACNQVSADFMGPTGDDFNPKRFRSGALDNWCWFARIDGELATLPIQKRYGTFFPVVRFSRRGAEALRRNFGKSSGFCEVYVPTVIAHEGLVIAPIPEEFVGRLAFSLSESFKALPIFLDPPKLFHPCKP